MFLGILNLHFRTLIKKYNTHDVTVTQKSEQKAVSTNYNS